MSATTGFVLVLIILLILWFFKKNVKKSPFYDNLTGPATIPLFGNALDFRNSQDVLANLEKYSRNYGGISKAKIGPFRNFILVSDYKFLERILSSTQLLKKSDDYKFLTPWLGTGLLTSDGHKWKSHRKILTPAFHFQILEQFIERFESCGEKLVEKLGKEVGKNSVDIYPYVTLCTLDIICESTMGVSINAQDNQESDYVQSVKTMTKIATERAISPIQMYDFLYPLTRNFYKQKKAVKILHQQSNSVIERRQKQLNNEKNDIEKTEIKKKKAFLDTLVDAKIDGKPLTQEEIREEVDTFMFEGHDTTASAISFALYCLANHSEVQTRAFEEQLRIFGSADPPVVTYADLQNMKFLEQVIKETLRLYPSVPIFLRETNEAVEYEGVHLPKGDTILIFAYGIQRDSQYFKDPEEFKPERFEVNDGKLPYAYIPFSAGPRNCIGQKFAMLEMKSTLSKVLRKYKLKPANPNPPLKLAVDTILKSSDGIKISFDLRNCENVDSF